MEEELVKMEEEFADAIVRNNPEDIRQLLPMTGSSSMPTEESSTGSAFWR
jgi:hypothetical protein